MMEERAVLVFNGRGPHLRRLDGGGNATCGNCEHFSERGGRCALGMTHPFPLSETFCTEWSARKAPNECKPCLNCERSLTVRYFGDYCDGVCEAVHKNMRKPPCFA